MHTQDREGIKILTRTNVVFQGSFKRGGSIQFGHEPGNTSHGYGRTNNMRSPSEPHLAYTQKGSRGDKVVNYRKMYLL